MELLAAEEGSPDATESARLQLHVQRAREEQQKRSPLESPGCKSVGVFVTLSSVCLEPVCDGQGEGDRSLAPPGPALGFTGPSAGLLNWCPCAPRQPGLAAWRGRRDRAERTRRPAHLMVGESHRSPQRPLSPPLPQNGRAEGT